MKKKYLIFIVFLGILYAEEPSAFKAGDLDNPNPYGLTQSEKKIVEQNKNIQSISRTVFDTNQTQVELKNELDGIKSLLGSISEKQFVFADKLDSDKNGSLKDAQTKVEALSKKLDDNFKLQNENYDKIMATLTEMAKMIDNLSQNYVSKEQLKLNLGSKYKDLKVKKSKTAINKNEVNDSATQKDESDKTTNSDEAIQNDSTQVKEDVKISNDDIFKKAEQLYKNNKFPEAKKEFLKIVDKKYSKTATVEFYLGEIDYKNSEYKDALSHFQESINSDDTSSFIPLMLYHSGISLSKLDDKKSAKKVLDTLIKTYPKSYLVPQAKKKLSEL